MALIFLFFFTLAIPFISVADSVGYILQPLPGFDEKAGGLGGYFTSMYQWIIGIAGVLAVLMIVVAGIEYMTPTPSSKESAKNRAWAAISGLLLALVSYLILNTINPDLVKQSITLPNVSIQKAPENTNELFSARQLFQARLNQEQTFKAAIKDYADYSASLQEQQDELLTQWQEAPANSELRKVIEQNIRNLDAQIIQNNNAQNTLEQLKAVATQNRIAEAKLLTEKVISASNKEEDKQIEKKCNDEINSNWLTKGSIIYYNFCLVKNAHGFFKVY